MITLWVAPVSAYSLGSQSGQSKHTYKRRYLTFFFGHRTWQFTQPEEETATQRPPSGDMIPRLGVEFSISSLTWACSVAYLSGRQPRPDDEMSTSSTPTSFFVYAGLGVYRDKTNTETLSFVAANNRTKHTCEFLDSVALLRSYIYCV